jgi:hypothetical protein
MEIFRTKHLNMRIILLLIILLPGLLHAQKKLVPVGKTSLLELELPAGSKKDTRSISLSAANVLLSSESKSTGWTAGNTEVYIIAGDTYNRRRLHETLTRSAYTVSRPFPDTNMSLASANGKHFIIFFSAGKGSADLYIAEGSQASKPVSSTGAAGPPVQPPATPSGTTPAKTGTYQFNTSNFDDGWKATIETDWVLLEKGKASVYLYYVLPYSSDLFSGTGLMERDYYWDNYVAKQFSTTTKMYRDNGEVISSFMPKYVEGYGKDPRTGETRFVAMTVGISPNAAMLTVALYPDEASFRAQFPKANDKFDPDLHRMKRYNKFAIGPSDLIGSWQSGGTQMTQWYDARTGAYAGATMAASSATFNFAGDGQYTSIHNGATGAVGAMQTFQQEYKGTYSVQNWKVAATNRYQGQTGYFDAHFQAVRGGRLLYLNDGKGSEYLLVKIK